MWLAAALLAIVLILDLTALLAKDRSYSESENRMLAGFPKMSAAEIQSGKWFSGLESYQARLRADRVEGMMEKSVRLGI